MDVGFIFGNIDEKTGKVEADYLDAVSTSPCAC